MELVISNRPIYEGQVVTLRLEEVETRNGRFFTREIVETRDTVVVVALDDQGNVMLVQQYRRPANTILLEVPAGGIEAGESPDQAAHRELIEETGYEATVLGCIGGFYSAPGFCTEYLHLFIAEELHLVGAAPDEDEEITLVPTPLIDVPKLISIGMIRDAKSVAGLLQAIYLKQLI